MRRYEMHHMQQDVTVQYRGGCRIEVGAECVESSRGSVVLMWRARERVLTESERELERERDLERLRGVRFLETRETTYTAAPRHPLARALSRRYTL